LLFKKLYPLNFREIANRYEIHSKKHMKPKEKIPISFLSPNNHK